MFVNKSVLLILVWNFLVISVFHYVAICHKNNLIRLNDHLKHFFSGWCLIPVVLLYPLMGWLADTYFSRYTAIKFGMYVMWASSILSSLLAIFEYHFHAYVHVLGSLDLVVYIIMIIGLGFFQANIIQFGIDQVPAASSADLTSFISWYVWTFYSSEAVVELTQKCGSPSDLLAATLLLPLFLTLALLSDLLFSSCLVLEPVTDDPFKLILRVLQYAVNHKYPQLRSAFTYANDKRYSRLDLAKDIYGGPFSVEKVENVKTFFRILVLVAIMSPLIGIGYMYVDIVNRIIVIKSKSCYEEVTMTVLGSLFVVVFIPLYELLMKPLFRSYCWQLSSRSKFKVGIFCFLLSLAIDLTLELIHHHYHSGNKSGKCDLYSENTPNVGVSISVIPVLKFVESLGKMLLLGSFLEFICAQSPYSMKGLFFGLMYATCGICFLIAFFAFLPFHSSVAKVHWGNKVYGCRFWFFLAILVVSLFFSLCFVIMSCNYKKRQRNEDLTSVHTFAENYYDKSDPGDIM